MSRANETDWWKKPSAANKLLRYLRRHVMSLRVTYIVEGKPYLRVYSGILISYNDFPMWVTAGHVITELKKIVSSPNISELTSHWMDNCDIEDAQSIPVCLDSLVTFSIDNEDFDLAMVALRPYEVALIMAPGLQNEFLTPAVWKGHKTAKPDGFYLIGFPSESQELILDRTDDDYVHFKTRYQLACLPVDKIPKKPADQSNTFWDREFSFYGELCIDSNSGFKGVPKSISGTSGGPLFSIEMQDDGEIKYRLHAIQSAWLASKNMIRAESVDSLEAAIRYCIKLAEDDLNEMADEDRNAKLAEIFEHRWKGNLIDV